MANYLLRRESKAILKQMGYTENREKLLCPILKVLQMRYHDINIKEATKVIRDILHD
ncbi:MAG: hypothetical protein KAG56_09405 [Sulfurovaceae bacterium]|nr:hypothetical protein [Sulfurovaceae bacterium]